MVYGVIGRMAFTSAARRDAVLSDIVTTLGSRPRWSNEDNVERVLAAPVRQGTHGIILEARCQNRADADAVKARIETFATGQRQPVAGSWVATHECRHDGQGVCSESSRRVF